jgi:hypothetical protein
MYKHSGSSILWLYEIPQTEGELCETCLFSFLGVYLRHCLKGIRSPAPKEGTLRENWDPLQDKSEGETRCSISLVMNARSLQRLPTWNQLEHVIMRYWKQLEVPQNALFNPNIQSPFNIRNTTCQQRLNVVQISFSVPLFPSLQIVLRRANFGREFDIRWSPICCATCVLITESTFRKSLRCDNPSDYAARSTWWKVQKNWLRRTEDG